MVQFTFAYQVVDMAWMILEADDISYHCGLYSFVNKQTHTVLNAYEPGCQETGFHCIVKYFWQILLKHKTD